MVLPRAGSLPPPSACLLAPKQQSTKCTESLLPAAGIVIIFFINIVNVAGRNCAYPPHAGGFYGGNETLA